MEIIVFLIGLAGGCLVGYFYTNLCWQGRTYSDHGILKSNAVRLKQIFQNSEIETAPQTVNFMAPHYEIVVGIGRDETASIYISRDALDELAKVCI